jgi:ABC-2 type transport system permease protein
MTTQPAIHAEHLTKWFPRPRRLRDLLPPYALHPSTGAGDGTLAVDHASFDVWPGEVFGLVGPNGAGKTTLVKMLATLILPTSGTARVYGHDLRDEAAIKQHLGLVTCNERSFYPRLTCRENLRFYGGLQDLSAERIARRLDELAALLDMGDFLDKRFDRCSRGMKHRVALARGLLHDPTLLFLDEPTRSLDPLAAERFRETLHTLARQAGHTVFLVTHNLEEAVDLCDRVGVMLRGRLRPVDDPAALRDRVKTAARCRLQVRWEAAPEGAPDLTQALLTHPGVREVAVDHPGADRATLLLRLQDRKRVLPDVVRTVEGRGAAVEALDFEAASWDEIFDELPGELPGDEATASRRPSGARAGPRPAPEPRTASLAAKLQKVWLFLRRDLKLQMSYRLSFVMQVIGILFSVASSYFVAQLLGAQVNPQLQAYGGDYFAFVLIGIAFTGYQGVALYTFSGVVQSAQQMGTLEAMLVTPTRLATILFASSLWRFAFTSLRVVVYLLMGALLFDANFRQARVLPALLILVLTVLSLSGLGILSACFVMVFKRGSPLNFLIGSLSTLLSGVYYPVAVLPTWLQALARVYPLTYTLAAMRRALLTGASLGDLALDVGVLAAFAALLLPASLVAFRHAVRQAKRDGSLTQF